MSDHDRIRAAQFLLTQFGILDAQPATDLAAEYQAIRLAERAQIVAWLRTTAVDWNDSIEPRNVLRLLANRIQRGEHTGTRGAREGAG